jgi:hypothetical protein
MATRYFFSTWFLPQSWHPRRAAATSKPVVAASPLPEPEASEQAASPAPKQAETALTS